MSPGVVGENPTSGSTKIIPKARAANNPDLAPYTKPPSRVLHPTLLKAWENGKQPPAADYQPTSDDTLICEALLAGATTPTQLAQYTGLPLPTLRTLLSSPQTMSWVSSKIRDLLALSVGVVDAALFQQASAGNIAATRLFFERHRYLQASPHTTVNIDLRKLPTEDLVALVADRKNRVADALPVDAVVSDAEPK